MANYRFSPKKKQTDFKAYTERTLNSGLYKSALKVAVVIVAVAFVAYIGVGVTGAFFYSNPDYDEVSGNDDFPKLSKKDANLELYQCRNNLTRSSSEIDRCNMFLADAESNYMACSNQKEMIESELQTANDNYNSCKANEESMNSNIESCNSDKVVIESHLATCNNLLKEKDIEYRNYKSEKEELMQNYANSVCCTLKQLSNPALNYYIVENNKIVCSETEGEAFNC